MAHIVFVDEGFPRLVEMLFSSLWEFKVSQPQCFVPKGSLRKTFPSCSLSDICNPPSVMNLPGKTPFSSIKH